MSQVMQTPVDLMIEYSSNFEKKQRNLMKRKLKLDSYKDMLRKGQNLTPDQEKAISEYDSVCQNIAALKETTELLAELQAKISHSFKETEKQFQAMRVQHTTEVLRNLSPLLELLSKIQAPVVKAAIIKASSQQQFKILENLSKTVMTQLPEGVESDKIEELLRTDKSFLSSAESLFKLSSGVATSINGKSKSPTYAEIRQTCLGLLMDDTVRAALAAPFAEVPKRKTTPRIAELSRPNATQSSEESSVSSDHVEVGHTEITNRTPPLEKTLPAEAILNSVINPLKTNFNFLQASHVEPVLHAVAPAAPAPTQRELPKPASVEPPTPREPVHVSPVPVLPPVVNKEVEETPSPKVEIPEQPQATEEPVAPQEPAEPVESVEKPKPKLARRNGGNKAQAKPPHTSLQEVMDAELAQQQQKSGTAVGAVKSWADRVRGAPAPQVNDEPKVVKVPTPTQHQNGHSERPVSREQQHPRDGREHRPSPRTHIDGGELPSNGRHAPRGGFRGGRGRGSGGPPFRGGRGRGAPRGSFHPRAGDMHKNGAAAPGPRQAPIQSTC